jgi:hypothetical protein
MALLYIDNNVIDLTALTGIEADTDEGWVMLHLHGTKLQIDNNPDFIRVMKKFLDLEGQTIRFEDLLANENNIQTLLDGMIKLQIQPGVIEAIKDPERYLKALKQMKAEDNATRQMNFQFGATDTGVN